MPARDGFGALPAPIPGTGPYGTVTVSGSTAVALTFDDGPNPTWTPKILALLRQYGIRATFCMVGTEAARYPDLVRAVAADGHTLCNHSWNHDLQLGRRGVDQIRADMRRTNDAIRAAVPGARIPYFRQPGGRWTDAVVSVARDLGMVSLHWTVDPQDWRRPGADVIAGRVLSQTTSGAVVLLHDGGGDRSGTYAACQRILPALRGRVELHALP